MNKTRNFKNIYKISFKNRKFNSYKINQNL